MKRTTRWTEVLAAGLISLAACSKQDSGPAITAGPENNERPTYGSATDIISTNNPTMEASAQNRADIGLGGPTQRESGNYQSQPLPGQNSDNELEKQIKVALTTGSTGTTGVIAEDQLTRIGVEVQNGVVTLSGPVSSEQEKEIIGKQVAGMKGVREVKNNLTVGGRSVDDIPLKPLVPRNP